MKKAFLMFFAPFCLGLITVVLGCQDDSGVGGDDLVGGPGPSSFTDNGNGTFTDNNTGLMWEIKADDGTIHDVDNEYTWSANAFEPNGTLFTVFLAGLNNSAFAGFSDWCIPNVERLGSIVDYSKFNPASSVPGLTAASNYWSSTTHPFTPFNSTVAWLVNFFHGNVGGGSKRIDSHARAVRPCP